MSDLKRSAKMKSPAKVLVFLGASYVGLWFATRILASDALESQVTKQIVVSHQTRPAPDESPTGGWEFKVQNIFCPAPLIFKAESDYVLTSHEGNGEAGWYVWTPWRVYTLSSHYTWIS
jgi:hypothetical protein